MDLKMGSAPVPVSALNCFDTLAILMIVPFLDGWVTNLTSLLCLVLIMFIIPLICTYVDVPVLEEDRISTLDVAEDRIGVCVRYACNACRWFGGNFKFHMTLESNELNFDGITLLRRSTERVSCQMQETITM